MFKATILFAAAVAMSISGLAQQPANLSQPELTSSSVLPDEPAPQNARNSGAQSEQPITSATSANLAGPIGPVPPLLTGGRLSVGDKFSIYVHQAFGPPALVFPAIGAGLRMADPPKNYPREWTDGGEAFGRLYGSAIAVQTSKRTAKVLTESLFREDPRYQAAAEGTGFAGRFAHAIAFTFVDKSDSGTRELAFSNYASATAGGFVGMAYLPDEFNDASHAGRRMGTEFLDIGIANIAREFAPQWVPVARKLHLPRIVPAWWVPEAVHHP